MASHTKSFGLKFNNLCLTEGDDFYQNRLNYNTMIGSGSLNFFKARSDIRSRVSTTKFHLLTMDTKERKSSMEVSSLSSLIMKLVVSH